MANKLGQLMNFWHRQHSNQGITSTHNPDVAMIYSIPLFSNLNKQLFSQCIFWILETSDQIFSQQPNRLSMDADVTFILDINRHEHISLILFFSSNHRTIQSLLFTPIQERIPLKHYCVITKTINFQREELDNLMEPNRQYLQLLMR